MGRKSGPNKKKIIKIREALIENPSGLWIREISRITGISKSTVSLYVTKYMGNEISSIFETTNGWIKIVRLKK